MKKTEAENKRSDSTAMAEGQARTSPSGSANRAEPTAQARQEPSAEEEPLMPLDPSTVTPQQLTELKERAAKADEHWDRLLRTTADFDNYKKRALREKQDAVKFANESLLTRLITVLDNFDMALAATQTASVEGTEALQQGINMIYQQFKSVLQEAGLEEIDARGKVFDPNLHEAVSQQPSAEVPEGHVLQQLRKGYKLKERLLRPASVVVAAKPQ